METITGSGLGYGSSVSATVGWVPAAVVYAGRGTPVGNDLIQIRIPAGVSGCYLPLAVTVGQRSTTSRTVSVSADGAPCQDFVHLSASDLALLDKGGTIAVGGINLSSTLQAPASTAASRLESASIRFALWGANFFAFPLDPPLAGCTVVSLLQTNITVGISDRSIFDPLYAPPDPGRSLALRNGSSLISFSDSAPGFFFGTLPPAQDGSLNALPPSAFPPGKWTLSSAGSADIPPLSFAFNLGPPLLLNGGSPLSLRRDQDQTITWNGASFDAASTFSHFIHGSDHDASCAAPATAGSLTIPAAILGVFPPASIGSLGAYVNAPRASLPYTMLKTTKGDTLLLFVSWSTGDNRPVDFQ